MASKRTNAFRAREFMAIRAMTAMPLTSPILKQQAINQRKHTMNIKLGNLFACDAAVEELSPTAKVSTRIRVESKRLNALQGVESVFGPTKDATPYDYSDRVRKSVARSTVTKVVSGNDAEIDNLRHSASRFVRSVVEETLSKLESKATSKKNA